MKQQVSFAIDWLSVVADSTDINRIGPSIAADAWQVTKGQNGYDTGFVDYATECKRFESSTRKDMGVLYVASSKAIGNMMRAIQTDDHIEALTAYGLDAGRATRIDLCFDVWDNGELASKLADVSRAGLLKSRSRKQSVIQSTDGSGGLTIYIGSRESPRFARIYNKSAQSSLKFPVTRFELEAKSKFAAQLWGMLYRSENKNALRVAVLGVWNAFITSWGLPEIDTIFNNCEVIEPPAREASQSSTKEWLTRQVVPCLVDSVLHSEIGDDLLSFLNIEVRKRIANKDAEQSSPTPFELPDSD